MSEIDESQIDRVASLLMNLGAPSEKVDVMARQLFKRAKQISQEREISEVEALEGLLKQVFEARQGS
ncbi:MAG: hypothetical protein ACPGSB_04075 [Opitutales bacterium]